MDIHDLDLFERRQWAGKAEVYERSFAAMCAFPAGQLLDMAGVGAGTRMLDVGTGSGTVARLGCERGASVTAVDAEPDMVRLAAVRVPQAEVSMGRLPELPFADETFDAVIANFVVNHVGDPGAAVAELRRVAAPGGRVAVSLWPPPREGAAQGLWYQAIDAAGATRQAGMPRVPQRLEFERSAEGLAGLLAGAGLSDVRCFDVSWTVNVDPGEWWTGPASGLGTVGFVLAAQTPEMVARIKGEYERITASSLDSEGRLALPLEAVLAAGLRQD